MVHGGLQPAVIGRLERPYGERWVTPRLRTQMRGQEMEHIASGTGGEHTHSQFWPARIPCLRDFLCPSSYRPGDDAGKTGARANSIGGRHHVIIVSHACNALDATKRSLNGKIRFSYHTFQNPLPLSVKSQGRLNCGTSFQRIEGRYQVSPRTEHSDTYLAGSSPGTVNTVRGYATKCQDCLMCAFN